MKKRITVSEAIDLAKTQDTNGMILYKAVAFDYISMWELKELCKDETVFVEIEVPDELEREPIDLDADEDEIFNDEFELKEVDLDEIEIELDKEVIEEIKQIEKKKRNTKPVDAGKIWALHDAGWSAAKIADEVGCAPATVYNVLNRGRS